jgi:hypothetical protein
MTNRTARFGVLLALLSFPASSVFCQPALTIDDLQNNIDRQISELRNIVMHEEIIRYSSVNGKTRKIDEFDAEVEMDGSGERSEFLARNGRPYTKPARIPGAWSFGDFSSLLCISREALTTVSAATDSAAVMGAFHYPASSKRWFVAVDGRVYWLDFNGEITLSARTGDALRIAWTSAPPASDSGIVRIQRTVVFVSADVGGQTYVVPQSAEYRVFYRGNRIDWNYARFTDPVRYGSSVSVKYEE